MPDITLAPNVLWTIAGVDIDNSLFTFLLITVVLVAGALWARRGYGMVPSRTQAFMELVCGFLLDQLEQAFESRTRARHFLPVLLTVLLVITLANQFSLVPFVGQLVTEGTPVFRTATAHLSATLSLAAVVVLGSHILAFAARPLGHLGNYFPLQRILEIRSPGDVPGVIIDLFLGLLDVVGEISKVLSLAFRLFGNVFAGEVIIAIIVGLSAYTRFIVPVPFLVLSIFSGFVQAFVFAMLSTQFIAGTLKGALPPEPEPALSSSPSPV